MKLKDMLGKDLQLYCYWCDESTGTVRAPSIDWLQDHCDWTFERGYVPRVEGELCKQCRMDMLFQTIQERISAAKQPLNEPLLLQYAEKPRWSTGIVEA